VLIGVSVIVFGFVRLIPGDPAVIMLGEQATPETVAEMRQILGLDKPISEQYLIYLDSLRHGDLGKSILRGDPVAGELLRRFPATAELGLSAILIALLVGIPSGIVSARFRNSIFDNSSRLVALIGVSMPIFWLGLMLSWFFGVKLGWLPTGGLATTQLTLADERITGFMALDSLVTGDIALFRDHVRHLILPAVALATMPMAIFARMTRSSLLEVLGQDYVRTAQAKGLSDLVVTMRHAMRNALLPIITVVALQVGRLLSGTILTETVFSWPGVGLWAYEAITARDYPIIQGVTLFVAVVFVLSNLVADILSAAADPRIKYR